jgi:hypothetical protein
MQIIMAGSIGKIKNDHANCRLVLATVLGSIQHPPTQ